jgi:excisionase family DNA binding protein
MTERELRETLSDPVDKRQIARLLGVGIHTVYDALHRGQIPNRRVGRRRYVVPREAFIRWYLGDHLDGEGDAR